jgi:tetratricopeptide (TPR) repeat protein
LIAPTSTADDAPLSIAIASRLDSLLPTMLSTGDQVIRIESAVEATPMLLNAEGSVSRSALRRWTTRRAAGVLLACRIVRSRLSEAITTAPIQSTRNPGASKVVRQSRAEAVCRVLLIDLRRETLLFEDTLAVSATSETHAADAEPPLIDEAAIVDDLARRITAVIVDESHPVRDQDVVTFLIDSDFPEIGTAIVHAEEGRWSLASLLLRRLVDESEGEDNADLLWYDLGLTLQYQQNFKGALEAFDRAIMIRDRSRYRHARASLLLVEEEYLENIGPER